MKSRRKRTKARVPQGNPEAAAESVITSIVKTEDRRQHAAQAGSFATRAMGSVSWIFFHSLLTGFDQHSYSSQRIQMRSVTYSELQDPISGGAPVATERLILAVPYLRSLPKRRETTLFLCLAASILFTTPVRAQLLYGSLTGNVADTSGAAIAQAKVVLLEWR
jgi:hypothetical protein